MLVKRIITGIVGMLVTFYVVNLGGWLFGGAILLLSLVAWHEFCRAFANIDTKLWQGFGFLAIAFIIGCAWIGNANESVAVLTLTILLVLAKSVLDHANFSVQQACISVCGIFYIALSFSHLLLLRNIAEPEMLSTLFGGLSAGCAFIWLAFIGTWASDTFAFFAGSLFGKTKLCPEISPGKTKEGFVGGVLGTVLCSLGLGYACGFAFSHMAILGVLIAVSATIGDLVESSFKRLTGIKDSGQLLPGHGGVLDRFDSLMFTVPLVYYYIHIFTIY